MDSIPLDVQLQVLSYLSLNELVECRLVSHSFKQMLDESLRCITHVQVTNEREDESDVEDEEDANKKEDDKYKVYRTVKEAMKESYIGRTFYSKPLVKAHVLFDDQNSLCSEFFSFLREFCPNLRVLRMDDCSLFGDQLFALPPKLEFFTCRDFSPPRTRESAQQVHSPFVHLANLKGFLTDFSDASYNQRQIRFKKDFLKLNGAVCQILTQEVDPEVLQLLNRGGTKCLHLDLDQSVFSSFAISQPLAGSLVELSLDFLPTGKLCPFSLPNLLYLAVNCSDRRQAMRPSEGFISTPNLRSFTYRGWITSEVLCQMMNYIHSLDKLRVLRLNDFYFGLQSEVLRVTLPHNLEKLAIKMNRPFQLIDHSSPSLRCLVVTDMSELLFDMPNLEVLICCHAKLSSHLHVQLQQSLSKCHKLRKVELWFGDSLFLQPLIDLLLGMKHLQHLALSSSDSTKTPTIHLKLRDDQSPKSLRLELLQTEIVLHLTGSFLSFQFDPSVLLRLKGLHKELHVEGKRVSILLN